VAIRVSPGVESALGELPVWEREQEDEQEPADKVGGKYGWNVWGTRRR
jgi:hypothetical protein